MTTPDDGTPEGRDPARQWVPPSRTGIIRDPSLRSRFSIRGRLVDHRTNCIIAFESGLERSIALVLMARDDVRELREQWPKVPYVDAQGHLRHHIFDFHATMFTGTRIAIAVKPAAKVEKSGLRQAIGCIEEQTSNQFADRFLIRTEEHVHPDDVVNARMMISARRLVDPEADAIVSKLVSSLRGTAVLGELVKATGLEGRGFAALVRKIGCGSLCLVNDGHIRPRSIVRLCQD